MKRILLSLLSIGAVAAVATAASGAYFTDTETSTGNTFQAGNLNLVFTHDYWKNDGVVGEPWTSNDFTSLPGGALFFNFSDIKPGDWGVSKLGYKVTNEAWMCAQLDKTSGGTVLSDSMKVFWWMDSDMDGFLDLVEHPYIMFNNPQTLTYFVDWNKFTFADSTHSIFGEPGGVSNPVPQNNPQYMGFAWCLGDININANGTTHGFTCDGSLVDDSVQNQSVSFDISFTAEQHRNQPTYVCPEHNQIPISNVISL